jgi:hypothetical protein
MVTEDRPHRTVRVERTARPDTGVILGDRAIHNGHDRARADNHGKRRSSIDLRGFTFLQVTIVADLALEQVVVGRRLTWALAWPGRPIQSLSGVAIG